MWRERKSKKTGKWVNGLKGGRRWHSVKESKREKEREIKRWRKREGGGCYIKMPASIKQERSSGAESVAENSGGLLVSGSHQSQTANTRAHGETAKVVSAKRWAGSGIISYHCNGIYYKIVAEKSTIIIFCF